MQTKKWKSKVYAHFNPSEIIEQNGKIKYRFVCMAHPYVSYLMIIALSWSFSTFSSVNPVMRARHNDSTSNLKRHVDTCDGKIVYDEASITSFTHGSTYNKGFFQLLLVLWVARRARPFVIIQDPEFQRILRMLYGRVEIPSVNTLSSRLKETHAIAQLHVIEILKVRSCSFIFYSLVISLTRSSETRWSLSSVHWRLDGRKRYLIPWRDGTWGGEGQDLVIHPGLHRVRHCYLVLYWH